MKTGRRAIPLDAAHLKAFASELTEKALGALVGLQWSREGEEPVGRADGLATEVLRVIDVKKREWEVPVTISARPGNTAGPTAGGAHIRNTDPLAEGPLKSIVLWLNGKWTPAMLQREDFEVTKQIQSMLLHEVTHAMDYLDTGEATHPLRGDRGEAYYNQPHEVRAFARQVIDEVLKAYKVLLLQSRRSPGQKVPSGRVLIEQLLDSSRTWINIQDKLNDRNSRLIRQMVVRELQDAHPDRQLAARVISRWRATKSGCASR